MLNIRDRKRGSSSNQGRQRELQRLRRQDLLELLVGQMHEGDDLRATIDKQSRRITELEHLTQRLKDKLDLKDLQISHLAEKLNLKDEQIDHLKDRLNLKDEIIAHLSEGELSKVDEIAIIEARERIHELEVEEKHEEEREIEQDKEQAEELEQASKEKGIAIESESESAEDQTEPEADEEPATSAGDEDDAQAESETIAADDTADLGDVVERIDTESVPDDAATAEPDAEEPADE